MRRYEVWLCIHTSNYLGLIQPLEYAAPTRYGGEIMFHLNSQILMHLVCALRPVLLVRIISSRTENDNIDRCLIYGSFLR